MDAERSSLCNFVVNFLMEENYLLTAFELLHELLDDGRDAQTIRLKEFFSDPSRFPPDQISRYNSIRVADPQSLLEEKEALSEKLAISEYELRLAQEDIARLKAEGQKKSDCSIDKLKELEADEFGDNRPEIQRKKKDFSFTDIGPLKNNEFRKAQPDGGEARPYRFESSFKFPEKGIKLKELGVIILTAQFVERYGENFRRGLRRRVVMNTQFGFMVFGDRRHDFYCGILCAYSSVLRPCKRMKKSDACTDTVLEVFFEILQSQEEGEGIELHDFVGGVDSFAHVEDEQYSVVVPAPVHVLMNMIPRTLRLPDTLLLPPVKSSSIHDPAPRRPHDLASPTRRYTLREDCIIKVTAQFVARYGTKFTGALARRVAKTTQFEFMNPTSGRSRFYTWYVERLSEVLKPYKKGDAFYQEKKRDACMNTVLEGFFSCLDRLQQEEDEAVGVVALHGFVDVVDCFASMDHVLNQHLTPPGSQVHLGAYGQPLMGMMQPAPPKLGLMSLPPPLPLPEEPEPKRRKFDVSALAPEDRLHNFQGWSTIRVFVPNVGEVVIR